MKFEGNNYTKLMQYLYTIQDGKYRLFQQKLIKNDQITIIGVRTPELKKIAKEISKGNYLNFIQNNSHEIFEETVLHGLVLGFIKIKEDELLKLIDDFIPYINNWATNDLTVSNLKAFKKIDISQLKKYLKSPNPWEIRFGLTLLLSYYIKEENLTFIFTICDKIESDHYYVSMAKAWLLSICFIKFPEITYNYLTTCQLDKFTFNKTISKICDSYRVSQEYKEMVKKLRK